MSNLIKPPLGSKPRSSPIRKDLAFDFPYLGRGDFNDYTGNKNNIITNSGATHASGRFGPALNFTASGSDIITGGIVFPPYPHTIISYGMATATGTARFFNTTDVGSNTEYIALDMDVGNDWSYWCRGGGNSAITLASGSPVVGRLYHMAGVSTAFDEHKLYIDGVLAATNSSGANINIADQFGIGALNRSTPIFSDCQVSYTLLFSCALSAEEIKSLYETPWKPYRENKTPIWAAAQGVAPPVTGKPYYYYQRMRA